MNDKTQELSIADLANALNAHAEQLAAHAANLADVTTRLAALEEKVAQIQPTLSGDQMIELIDKLGAPIKTRLDELEAKIDAAGSGEAPGPYTSISKLKTPQKKPKPAYIKR
jgi:tetrahydromethanopterin S-methyltransferase subunit G